MCLGHTNWLHEPLSVFEIMGFFEEGWRLLNTVHILAPIRVFVKDQCLIRSAVIASMPVLGLLIMHILLV